MYYFQNRMKEFLSFISLYITLHHKLHRWSDFTSTCTNKGTKGKQTSYLIKSYFRCLSFPEGKYYSFCHFTILHCLGMLGMLYTAYVWRKKGIHEAIQGSPQMAVYP